MLRFLKANTSSGSLLARLLHTEVGFAGIEGLCRPRDWQTLAQDAAARCEELVYRVIVEPPSAQTVQTLDDISDVLCQVLDAAEFCRNAHSDAQWRAAAQQVCIDLGGYVQQLNMHYGLYTAISAALDGHLREAAAVSGASSSSSSSSSSSTNCTYKGSGQANPAIAQNSSSSSSMSSSSNLGIREGWSEETVLVARMLKRDFEKYGVHLSGHSRDRMNTLVAQAQELGMGITRNLVDPALVGTLELVGEAAAATERLPHHLRRSFRPLADKRSGRVLGVSSPAESSILNAIMRQCDGEELRRQAFLAYTQQPAANIGLLDQLVEARHEIASIMGFTSYAHYQLDGVTLANRPEAVQAFMQHLSTSIQPKCRQELEQLQRAKQQGGAGGSTVQPWDRGYLLGLCKAAEGSRGVDLSLLQEYFQLEQVVAGLSGLLEQLMGVSLEERPLEKGEGWAPGVRKLAAMHHTEGPLGTVYLDLYQRASGKFPGAAHFTLRCGRRRADGSYQTPVVALLANLAPNAELSYSEVEMLFHEFGHAIHSLLSRTHFQHLAGTRGPLDTVEIPSHTMEHFALDARVLAPFAVHRRNGTPLPQKCISALRDSRRKFAGLKMETQLVYCAIDQLLHGPDPPTGQRAQQAVGELVQQYSSLGHVAGTYPHLRFNHIVGYGASYYSYLYAQCLSANIWQQHFAADPLSRTAGEALRHKLLAPGGAQDAHAIVEGLLGPAMMHEEHGGWYPDAHSMLEQQGLLVA